MNTKQLKQQHNDAIKYFNLIGKAQPHFRDDEEGGKLTTMKVQTEICHQAYTGAQNYHNHPQFDMALAKVIKNNFKDLAAQAIELMYEEYKQSYIAEKASLLAQLEEIKALEEEE